MPAFLKFDFGEIPAVLAVMTLGPVAGIAVELIKNILHWLLSGSPTGVPVGEIANFTTGFYLSCRFTIFLINFVR